MKILSSCCCYFYWISLLHGAAAAFILLFCSSNPSCFAIQDSFASKPNMPTGNKPQNMGENSNPFRNNSGGSTNSFGVFGVGKNFVQLAAGVKKKLWPIKQNGMMKRIEAIRRNSRRNEMQNNFINEIDDEEEYGVEEVEAADNAAKVEERQKRLLQGFFANNSLEENLNEGEFHPTITSSHFDAETINFHLFLISVNLHNLSQSVVKSQEWVNYDEESAKKLAVLSGAAYLNFGSERTERNRRMQRVIEKVLGEEDNWRFVDYIEGECDRLNNSCAFYVAKCFKTKQLIVIFRGSNSNGQLALQGWDSFSQQRGVPFDKNFKKDPKRVNGYFMRAHRKLWDQLSSTISLHKDYHIVFSGHSLGGALATLAAIDSVHTLHVPTKNIQLYTFGQPRVGNYDFAKYVDEKLPNSIRITCGQDPVPHLPPSDHELAIFLAPAHTAQCDENCEINSKNYHHGIEVWYENGLQEAPKIIVDSDRLDNANGWDRWKDWTKSLGDLFASATLTYRHHQAYIEWLKNHFKK